MDNVRKKAGVILGVLFVLTVGSMTYGQNIHIQGAGASFPKPLFDHLFRKYEESYSVTVSYGATGSGTGLTLLQNKKVDFAVTDIPSNEKPAAEEMIYIPVTVGAVAVVYNLPDVGTLKLTPDVLANILMGKITKWNDGAIKRLNSGVTLPSLPIKVFYREDVSGTTWMLDQYLTHSSPVWKKEMTVKEGVKWRVGTPVQDNEAMSKQVQAVAGGIGYTSLYHTLGFGLSAAAILNKSGKYIVPTSGSILSAVENLSERTLSGAALSTTDMEYGYPITGMSWIVSHRELSYLSQKKAKQMVHFFWWLTHEGQLYAEDHGFPSLTEPMMKHATNQVKKVTYRNVGLY